MRALYVLIAFFIYQVSLAAQSLTAMEAILHEAETPSRFFADKALQGRYIEAASMYFGIAQSERAADFRSYAERNLKELEALDPQVWDALWRQRSPDEAGRDFEISARFRGFGFSFDETLWKQRFLPRLYSELKERMGKHVRDLRTLKDRIRAKIKIAQESKTRRERDDLFRALRSSAEVLALQAYYFSEFLNQEENRDILNGALGESVVNLLRRFNDGRWLSAARVGPSESDLDSVLNLDQKNSLEVVTEVLKAYEDARDLRRRFESIKGSDGRSSASVNLANDEKRALLDDFSKADRLFRIETVSNPTNHKLLIKSPGNTAYFRAVRREMHSIFRCFLPKHCLKDSRGAWLTGALSNARIYFSEKSPEHATGHVQIFPVQNRSGDTFGALEIMTPDTKGELIVHDPVSGIDIKHSVMDLLINELASQLPKAWRGLEISDGNNANNAGGKTWLFPSLAWLGAEHIERGGQLRIIDPLLPLVVGSHHGGKISSDGVATSKVFHLSTLRERSRISDQEIEERNFETALGLKRETKFWPRLLMERGLSYGDTEPLLRRNLSKAMSEIERLRQDNFSDVVDFFALFKSLKILSRIDPAVQQTISETVRDIFNMLVATKFNRTQKIFPARKIEAHDDIYKMIFDYDPEYYPSALAQADASFIKASLTSDLPMLARNQNFFGTLLTHPIVTQLFAANADEARTIFNNSEFMAQLSAPLIKRLIDMSGHNAFSHDLSRHFQDLPAAERDDEDVQKALATSPSPALQALFVSNSTALTNYPQLLPIYLASEFSEFSMTRFIDTQGQRLLQNPGLFSSFLKGCIARSFVNPLQRFLTAFATEMTAEQRRQLVLSFYEVIQGQVKAKLSASATNAADASWGDFLQGLAHSNALNSNSPQFFIELALKSLDAKSSTYLFKFLLKNYERGTAGILERELLNASLGLDPRFFAAILRSAPELFFAFPELTPKLIDHGLALDSRLLHGTDFSESVARSLVTGSGSPDKLILIIPKLSPRAVKSILSTAHPFYRTCLRWSQWAQLFVIRIAELGEAVSLSPASQHLLADLLILSKNFGELDSNVFSKLLPILDWDGLNAMSDQQYVSVESREHDELVEVAQAKLREGPVELNVLKTSLFQEHLSVFLPIVLSTVDKAQPNVSRHYVQNILSELANVSVPYFFSLASNEEFSSFMELLPWEGDSPSIRERKRAFFMAIVRSAGRLETAKSDRLRSLNELAVSTGDSEIERHAKKKLLRCEYRLRLVRTL